MANAPEFPVKRASSHSQSGAAWCPSSTNGTYIALRVGATGKDEICSLRTS